MSLRSFFRSGRRGAWYLMALLACVSGCNSKPDAGAGPGIPSAKKDLRRVILLTNGNSPYWDACRAGMQNAEKDLGLKDRGLAATMEVNDGTVAGQLDKLRQYGSQADVAALAISSIDAKNVGVANELKALRKKGVAVITIDSDMDRETFRDARTLFIGTDNYTAGVELGKCAKQLRPDGGKYVSFVGITDAQNAIDRIRGVADGAGEKFQSADTMADSFDQSRARENVRNSIVNHPDLNVLVGIYSYNGPAIVDVVKERGKRDAYSTLIFDAEPNAIREMGAGQVDAMVVQNPYQMGFQGVKLLKALVEDDQASIKELLPKFGEPEGDIYDTGIKVIVPDEGSAIKREEFDAKTEFLKFSEFRDWLKKYKLAGS